MPVWSHHRQRAQRRAVIRPLAVDNPAPPRRRHRQLEGGFDRLAAAIAEVAGLERRTGGAYEALGEPAGKGIQAFDVQVRRVFGEMALQRVEQRRRIVAEIQAAEPRHPVGVELALVTLQVAAVRAHEMLVAARQRQELRERRVDVFAEGPEAHVEEMRSYD
jgi:hypothetical protein